MAISMSLHFRQLSLFTMISSRLLLIILLTSEIISANPVTKEKKVMLFLNFSPLEYDYLIRLAKKPVKTELEEGEMETAARRSATRVWRNSSSPLTAWEHPSASGKWSGAWGKLTRRRWDLIINIVHYNGLLDWVGEAHEERFRWHEKASGRKSTARR